MLKGTNKYAETDTLAYLDYYENDEWIGWCGLGICSDEKTIMLHSVQIRGEYQNQGYGSKMIAEVIEFYKEQFSSNYPRLILRVLKSNIPALKIYIKNGFRVYEIEDSFLEYLEEDRSDEKPYKQYIFRMELNDKEDK